MASKTVKKQKPWHEDYTLVDNPDIVIRIDDKAIRNVVAFAISGDIAAVNDSAFSSHDLSDLYFETIAYWCDRITADVDFLDETISEHDVFHDADGNENFDVYEHLNRGGRFWIHDSIENEEYELTKEKLVSGIKSALDEWYDRCGYDVNEMISDETLVYDEKHKIYKFNYPDEYNTFGDIAFQFALFEDLQYDSNSVRMHGAIRIHIPRYRPFSPYS